MPSQEYEGLEYLPSLASWLTALSDSPAASSDNDNDEIMEEADTADLTGEAEGEGEGDGDEGEDNEDNDDEDDQDDGQEALDRDGSGPGSAAPQEEAMNGDATRSKAVHYEDDEAAGSAPQNTTPEGKMARLSPSSPVSLRASLSRPRVRDEALRANVYDIAPTIAAPHSTSINAITATPDMRWVFSAGADGWIRKFDWMDTVNAKTMLTVAQRHPFVDSVTKAGVLASYWENEEPSEAPALSAAYSLAVQRHALWLLSGTEVGAINLQAVRHDEGKRITSLHKHTSAVSVMCLSLDETSFLSGSWDKTILDWDLNTGQSTRDFLGSGSQISAIEMRPCSATPIPEDTLASENATLASHSDATHRATTSGNENDEPAQSGRVVQDVVGSPTDSLFNEDDENNSLFGDNENDGAGNMGFGVDDDNEFSRAIASDIQQQGHIHAIDLKEEVSESLSHVNGSANEGPVSALQDPEKGVSSPMREGRVSSFPLAEAAEPSSSSVPLAPEEPGMQSESTFLDASIDGTLRVWDRRQRRPIARMLPQNVPPWCMHASWSPDGNFIYAGRRNGTVDEYNIHNGLRGPVRSLRFPGGSGAVSAVRAMPNSKHIICASYDILRLYDLHDLESAKHSRVPFLIVPGHRTGVVSHLYIDPTCSFMISTGGNRGWEGSSTEVLLGYEIGTG
ncbi:MAG: Transcription factor spt8 [Chrysothrix sp. TS-e1954]|nr:MAG: Transcription factor spt8 [Chrysothrix sp. TS-e1954]